MIKTFRLSVISAVALLSLSSASFAANYKGEDFKAETVVQQETYQAPVTVCAKDHCLSDGAYLGAGLGYNSFRVKQSTAIGAVSYNPAISVAGLSGSLFAGYGSYFDRFYLAGELAASMTNAEQSYSVVSGTSTYDQRLRARQSYSASILPGIKVSDSTLVYGRVGYIRTSFKADESRTVAGVNTSATETRWVNGVTYGVGLETLVAENVSLRGEYDYTNYNSFRTQTLSNKFKASNNQFTLGLIYHFA